MMSILNKRKQIRFSAKDDIYLLKEVLAENAFSSKNWTIVAKNVSQAAEREFEIDARRQEQELDYCWSSTNQKVRP